MKWAMTIHHPSRKKIAQAVANRFRRPIELNPTLVHHGLATAARWHVVTSNKQTPLADLYRMTSREAAKVAEEIATVVRVPVLLLSNRHTPASLADHPIVRSAGGHFTHGPRGNPSRIPAAGELWTSIATGEKCRVVSVSRNRVTYLELGGGNRVTTEITEFISTHRAPRARLNPRGRKNPRLPNQVKGYLLSQLELPEKSGAALDRALSESAATASRLLDQNPRRNPSRSPLARSRRRARRSTLRRQGQGIGGRRTVRALARGDVRQAQYRALQSKYRYRALHPPVGNPKGRNTPFARLEAAHTKTITAYAQLPPVHLRTPSQKRRGQVLIARLKRFADMIQKRYRGALLKPNPRGRKSLDAVTRKHLAAWLSNNRRGGIATARTKIYWALAQYPDLIEQGRSWSEIERLGEDAEGLGGRSPNPRGRYRTKSAAGSWYGWKPGERFRLKIEVATVSGETHPAGTMGTVTLSHHEAQSGTVYAVFDDTPSKFPEAVAAKWLEPVNPNPGRSGRKVGGRSSRKGPRTARARRNPRSDRAAAEAMFQKWQDRPDARGKWHRMKGPSRVPRHLAGLGELVEVVYESNKYDGKKKLYKHRTKRPRPVLAAGDGHVFVVGGNMKATPDGLVN